jgi:uncharacterized protein (TIGR03382 family)
MMTNYKFSLFAFLVFAYPAHASVSIFQSPDGPAKRKISIVAHTGQDPLHSVIDEVPKIFGITTVDLINETDFTTKKILYSNVELQLRSEFFNDVNSIGLFDDSLTSIGIDLHGGQSLSVDQGSTSSAAIPAPPAFMLAIVGLAARSRRRR